MFKLRFFGTDETAIVSDKFIKPYTEKFIELFNKPNLMTRFEGAFKAGVEQIAAAAAARVKEDLSMAGSYVRDIEMNMEVLSMDLAVPFPASDVENSNETESEADTDEAFMFKRERPFLSSPKLQSLKATIDTFNRKSIHIEDPAKRKTSQIQFELIQLTMEIKKSLGLKKADLDLAMELLLMLKEETLPVMTSAILQMCPELLDVIYKISNYIGNSEAWKKMGEPETKALAEKTSKLRTVAVKIIEGFKVNSLIILLARFTFISFSLQMLPSSL